VLPVRARSSPSCLRRAERPHAPPLRIAEHRARDGKIYGGIVAAQKFDQVFEVERGLARGDDAPDFVPVRRGERANERAHRAVADDGKFHGHAAPFPVTASGATRKSPFEDSRSRNSRTSRA
jgi:hypothetical protein